MVLNFLLSLLGLVIGVVLGVYVLLFGRRALWSTLGIIGLAAVANLLAVLVAGVNSGWDLIDQGAWGMLGIAVGAGVLGGVCGRGRSGPLVL